MTPQYRRPWTADELAMINDWLAVHEVTRPDGEWRAWLPYDRAAASRSARLRWAIRQRKQDAEEADEAA